MKFDDSLGEGLQTALRKCCDSTATTAAWNAIYLLKDENWKSLLQSIQEGFADFEFSEEEQGNEKKRRQALGRRLSVAVKKWEPYGQGHDAVTLHCIFGLFDEGEWSGFAGFLHHSIMKETPPDFAARLAWIAEIVPSIAPASKAGWQPPAEPGRWLMLTRNAEGAVDSASIYEVLKTAAEVIDVMDSYPDRVEVVDLDERKLYHPERKTVAFVQPGRAMESRIEL